MEDKQVHVQTSRSDGPTDQFSLEQILEFLVAVEYPARKQDLVAHARKQKAPPETLSLIEQLPEQRYNSSRDLMKVINQVN